MFITDMNATFVDDKVNIITLLLLQIVFNVSCDWN